MAILAHGTGPTVPRTYTFPDADATILTNLSAIAESQITNLVADLAAKAPLASPALTGTPTAPTAGVGTNTTQVATTAFVLANGGGGVDPGLCEGRLTLTSGTPVTTADVTGATNLYWTPMGGGRMALYDGASAWVTLTFTEITQALGTLVNGQAYDLFAYNNAGAVALEMLEWKNATITMTIAAPGVVTWTAHGLATGKTVSFTTSGALPTGVTANTVYYVTVVDANSFKLSTTQANLIAATFITTTGSQSGTHTGHHPYAQQTALVLQDGVLVKSGATTRRYLASFQMTSTTTTEDSYANRLVSNYYNRRLRTVRRIETATTWTDATASWRQANLNVANQISWLTGVEEYPVSILVASAAANPSANVTIGSGFGIDAVSPHGTAQNLTYFSQVANVTIGNTCVGESFYGVGAHTAYWVEFSGAGTTTFQGSNTIAGIKADVWG